MTSRLCCALFLSLAACAAVHDDGDLDASADGKADALSADRRGAADHGALPLGAAQTAELTRAVRSHAWQLVLTAPATVAIETRAIVPGARAVDTVLALYRWNGSGWGRAIARNDDATGDTRWSALTRALSAGEYRVVVTGHRASTRGSFELATTCTDGCEEPGAMCLFGDTYRDLESQPALRVTGRRKWTAETRLSELDQRRVVLAVQQSSHTDVTTPAEAFARVDQGEINRVDVYEPAAARTFVVLEYGAGDNSYGAYFEGLSDALVARIHDGDVLDCSVVAETCVLGATYRDLRSDPAFTALEARRITQPTEVTGVEAEQVVRAVQESYDVATVAEALAAVDGGEINLARFRHEATGDIVEAVEYGAGDNSYGAVFYAGSTRLAAAIHDGDFYGCTLFVPRE